jgi:adenine-specific DNA-methyltransferase
VEKTKSEILLLIEKSLKIEENQGEENSGAGECEDDDTYIYTRDGSNSSDESQSYINQTMLTCIGNKRRLVHHISRIMEDVKRILGKRKLTTVDGFSGSAVVGRALSYSSEMIYSNDMEYYAYLISKCSLETPTSEQQERVRNHIRRMNEISDEVFRNPIKFQEGIIAKHYAPKETENIQDGERCFYTRENALIIDTLRSYIFSLNEEDIFAYLMVPLLCKSSIHTNTSGVFRGFHKKNGIGCFGGAGGKSLGRIKGQIKLDMPVWRWNSRTSGEAQSAETRFQAHCSNMNFNELIKMLPGDIDLIYPDPPYNQHSHGANYFMLNLIASDDKQNEKALTDVSPISGVPKFWKRSDYYYKQSALKAMKEVIEMGLSKSKFLLISYNDEGFIGEEEWTSLFTDLDTKKYEIEHGTFGGCRNFKNRNAKVTEILFLVSKHQSQPHPHPQG